MARPHRRIVRRLHPLESAHGLTPEIGHGQRLSPFQRGEDERLYPAQLDVLCGIADGMTNRQIADRRGTRESTVKRQVEQLCQKLHARNRAHAVAEGFRRGLLR